MLDAALSVMKTDVITVGPEATLEEVIKVLANNRISGLPVVDSEKKVVGVITEKDIVDYAGSLHVVPRIRTSGWISPHIDVSDIATVKKGYEMLAAVKVKKVMSDKPVTVGKGTNITEVARLMKKKNVNRIPVVDGEGKLVGIIARADLVNYLAEKES
ncbi:MAG: CBS domain-containing protein [Dethiobacter sp.]|nr:CBS domain-containing protein [Dethiobacter sp.]